MPPSLKGSPVRKTAIGAIIGLLAAVPAISHDFWIQPTRFFLAAPDRVPVVLFVGHGAARERWGVSADKVIQFRSIGPDGMIDRKGNLTIGAPGFDAIVPFARRGSYVLGLQSASSPSRLPHLRFNEYVAAEGIAPIALERKRRGHERREGREIYSRRAKAIVQVGPVDAASIARVVRPVNLKLEIVPERHPLTLGRDRKLPVRVLYHGRPLRGALVKITDLRSDAEPLAMRRTDATGRAIFAIPRAGNWQMNVVWAAPLRNDRRADFNTIFSSLTFATR
jgi:uncharacterized GH25 family protein